MKTFDIYNHPNFGYEAVKKGFSWPAFFFGPIWAFSRNLWILGLAYIVVSLALHTMITEIKPEATDTSLLFIFLANLLVGISYIVRFLLAIWFGIKGNEWVSNHLKKQSYELVKTLESETADEAITSITGVDSTLQEKKGILRRPIGILLIIIVLTAFSVFISWLPSLSHIFGLFNVLGEILWIKILFISMAVLTAGSLFWTFANKGSVLSLVSHIFTGALIVGSIGFIGGFFGPIIFMSDANQGPLIGFFTGPIGFLLGGLGGLIYGMICVIKKVD